jgi:hypothetical protein
MRSRLLAPAWGRVSTFSLAVVCALSMSAFAQPKGKRDDKRSEKTEPPPAAKQPAETKKQPVKEQNFNMDGFGLNGRSRSPQLLYFLERANEELERASLEKRSFIPHIVRTVDEEAL